MLSFLIHSYGFVKTGQFTLFMFFYLMIWAIYLIKIVRSSRFKPVPHTLEPGEEYPGVSVVIPVVDEKDDVWQMTLDTIQAACADLDHEIIVVANGKYSANNAAEVLKRDMQLIKISQASKRHALFEGSKVAKYPISILLDSDSFATPDTIKKLLPAFKDPMVGGITPRHIIHDREPFMRRVSDWLEDIRFNEVVRGQAVDGHISCLPGRLYAIRTDLFKRFGPSLLEQTFLGKRVISGDDRFLTSRLLEHGYKTLYQPESVVYTDAPDTLKGFVKQRLRWSRGAIRGTLSSIPWTFKYPYMTFTTFSNVIKRWLRFVVIVHAWLVLFGILKMEYLFWEDYEGVRTRLLIVSLLVASFFLSGALKQLRHFYSYPQDILFLPVYLFMTRIVLTPVEWYGNLTCGKSNWLTRQTEPTIGIPDTIPGLARLLVEQAILAIDIGDLEEVVMPPERTFESHKADANAYIDLAHTRLETGDTTFAHYALTKALQIMPAHPAALTKMGDLHKLESKNGEAISYYRSAIALDYDTIPAFVGLGETLLREQSVNSAEEAFKQAEHMLRNRSYPFQNRFGTRINAVDGNAFPGFDAIELAARIRVGLGHLALLKGKVKDAIRSFQGAIDIMPNHTDGYKGLAQAFLQLKHKETAELEIHIPLDATGPSRNEVQA